jgi:hypothetical protein
MRFSTPLEYLTIGQALLKGVCPFCTYLKNFQSKILRDLKHPSEIADVCNFHAWAMASASDKAVVSCIFRVLLKDWSIKDSGVCSLCKAISAEEEARMREFAAEISQTHVFDWVNVHGTFCIPHGTRFLAYITPPLQTVVLNVLKRSADQLGEDLEHLERDASDDKGPGGGILGHAAEFLVSRRGL